MKGRKLCLEPEVAKWLDVDEPCEAEEDAEDCFDDWVEQTECRDDLICLGKVMVDPQVVKTRFDCVPERCAPWSNRGRYKSCCADIYVPVDFRERRKMNKHRAALGAHLSRTEPRLSGILGNGGKPSTGFFLDEDGDALCRPGGRCVFSRMDKQGRLRCRLYTVANNEGMPVTDIQPFTCRIFPLVLVKRDRGKVLLTVLSRRNYRAFESYPPSRFPCLNDPKLPLLTDSMAGTLDWLFGKGFARMLATFA